MRVKLKSNNIDKIINEAILLVEDGTKELLIISQDTSAFGIDLKLPENKNKTNIVKLCKLLGELDVWIRLHYVYPYPHIGNIIPLMAENKLLLYQIYYFNIAILRF